MIFAAKRNIDITMIIHDNRVYGLTTGQYTPTSPLGFRGRSTPAGTRELPINPLELMLASGATFLARGTSHGIEQLKAIFKEAILHKGFSLVDVHDVENGTTSSYQANIIKEDLCVGCCAPMRLLLG